MQRKQKEIKLLRDMDTPMVLGIELDRTTLTPVRRPIKAAVVLIPVSGPIHGPEFPMCRPENQDFYVQTMSISDGTIASLTKLSKYTDIDNVRRQLAYFYLTHQDVPYEHWGEVWTAFRGEQDGTGSDRT